MGRGDPRGTERLSLFVQLLVEADDVGAHDDEPAAGHHERHALHLTDRLDIPVSALAYGEKRRLEIGLALTSMPSLLLLAWSWFATLFKLRSRAQTVTEWRGRRMVLDAKSRQCISIDGEIAARTPVTVECARGAIDVAAPRD